MSITPQERYNPSKEQLLETLELLKEAAHAGELASLAFMLHKPLTGQTIVDSRGSFELTEITCRTVNNRIADLVEQEHPHVAAAIRRDLVNQQLRKRH